MQPVLHIIATCTDKKSVPPAPKLRLRTVPRGTIAQRAAAWRERLACVAPPETFRSTETLYMGVAWANTRALFEAARMAGYDAHLWVVSAGQGLLGSANEVPSYSATFASGQADSVAGPGLESPDVHQAWWAELARPRERDPREVRSLADLARSSPKASWLYFGSPDYLTATRADLEEARALLRDPERMVVISSAARGQLADLRKSIVENDARLTHALGGALTSLHVRTARVILDAAAGAPLDVGHARNTVNRLLAQMPAFERPERKPMTDEQVCAFIARELRAKADAKASPLLRKLRDGGWMCEQKRFKSLYATVRGSTT